MNDKFCLLEEVEKGLGIDAAKRSVQVLGGQLISVPRKFKGSKLEEELGSELAKLLVDLRGGESLDVPTGRKYGKNRTRDAVVANPDLSANELARKLGVTRVRISQIRRELRQKTAVKA